MSKSFDAIIVGADCIRFEPRGAEIAGVGGDEAVHGILDTLSAQAPDTVLQRTVHVHPTVSELIPTMLGELKP